MALVIVRHAVPAHAQLTDRVGVLDGGQVVQIGEMRSVVKQPLHPYASGLMRSIPTISAPRTRLKLITGSTPEIGKLAVWLLVPSELPARDGCLPGNTTALEFRYSSKMKSVSSRNLDTTETCSDLSSLSSINTMSTATTLLALEDVSVEFGDVWPDAGRTVAVERVSQSVDLQPLTHSIPAERLLSRSRCLFAKRCSLIHAQCWTARQALRPVLDHVAACVMYGGENGMPIPPFSPSQAVVR